MRALVCCLLVMGGCSLIVERNANQCSEDKDCAHFGAQLYCTEGLCGPKACFAGTPMVTEDFQARCTSADCVPFDNCARLQLCNKSELPALIDPPPHPELHTMNIILHLVLAQTVPPTVPCYDPIDRPKVVYVAGSSAVQPFLGVVGANLAAQSPPYTIVYQSQGSCTGVSAIFSTDPSKRLIKDIPATATTPANYAVFFKADGKSQECALDPAGNTVDVGVSDVFFSTCGISKPTDVEIADAEGPIQPMTFVVPAASTQQTISAEAAYMVFGLGGNNGAAAPWTDPKLYFVRNDKSGTQQMIAGAITVPAKKWWGVDRGGSGAVRSKMKLILDAADAEKSIGILSTDITDSERADLHVLGFQAAGQSCSYWPDSTKFAEDKNNVRDGHYPIWGPVHFYYRTSGGVPSDAAAALAPRFAGAKLDQALLDTIINKHLVPKCAMKVKRTTEMGPLSPVASNDRCSCYFDALTATTACAKCTTNKDCGSDAPICNYGYCETP